MAEPQGAHVQHDSGVADSGAAPGPIDPIDPIDPPELPAQATACNVAAAVLVPKCSGCHRPGGQTPDLTYDAVLTALVGLESPVRPGTVYVVPDDPQASLLFRKIAGTQAASEGARMPLGVPLDEGSIALVQEWIEAGASVECELEEPPPPVERHHPDGFADPTVHGPELKLGRQDCRTCHGENLTGGSGPSCDSCHSGGTAWRTQCTFCHGGTETETGAPPRDLDGELDPMRISFRAHTPHVSERNHAPFDCVQCHLKPSDVLSARHVFDDTPGQAEVDFSGGLSAGGVYNGSGSCSNLYCHGNGRTAGSYDHLFARPDCGTCHGSISNGGSGLSDPHEDHLEEGVTCDQCHSATATARGTAILDPGRHVNGTIDVVLASGTLTRENGTCTGSCHGEEHGGRLWRDD